MISIAKAVGKLPFIGKLSLRPAVINFRCSANSRVRRTRYFRLVSTLVLMVISHAVQALVGFWAMGFDAPTSVRVYYCLYAASNAAVVLAHAEILIRSTFFLFRGPYPREAKRYPEPSKFEKWLAIGFTISAQAIMLVLLALYAPIR